MNEVVNLEKEMWVIASNRDKEAYEKIVAPDAAMICGGKRCTGAEYAEIIPLFDISGYQISFMEVISESETEVLLHYVIDIQVDNPEVADLAGTFHIASMWKKINDKWQLVFNMDSRTGV